MNDSIIIGISLIKICLFFTDVSRTSDNINNIYINYNKAQESEMENIIERINHKSITYNKNNINLYTKNVYYIMLLMISYIYKLLFWTNNDVIINILLLSLTTKSLKTLIFNHNYYIYVIQKIDEKVKNIYCYVLSKITTSAINNLNIICIGIHPDIKYYELLNFFENFKNYKDNMIVAIKSIINHLVVSSFKNSNNSVVRYLFTFIHKYQIEELSYVGNILNNTNDANLLTKKEIGTIIQNRNWNKLSSQKSINSVLKILTTANNDNDYIQININKLMFNILRYFTIWTFIYVNLYFAILSDCVVIHRAKINISKYNILAYIIGIIIIYFYSYGVGTFICVFGHLFIEIFLNFIKDVNTNKIYNKMCKYIFMSYSICCLRQYFLPQLLMISYYNNDKYGNLIMAFIYLLSTLSTFNIFHITCICLICYVSSIILCETENKLLFELDEVYIKKPNSTIKMNIIQDTNTVLEINNKQSSEYIFLENYIT